jgi:hypothetical protein
MQTHDPALHQDSGFAPSARPGMTARKLFHNRDCVSQTAAEPAVDRDSGGIVRIKRIFNDFGARAERLRADSGRIYSWRQMIR